MRSFPCIAPWFQTLKPSSKTPSATRGTISTCTRFHPSIWSREWWPESERPQISPWLWSPPSGRRSPGSPTSSSCWPNLLWHYLHETASYANPSSIGSTAAASTPWTFTRGDLSSVSSESQDFRDELRASCPYVSTARLYQSQWLSFCGWCRGRSVTPIDATIPMIVDFLIHLREDKGFSLSSLKGYCSTINSVFTLKGMDLANSKELSMLFRSFAKTCSPQDLRPSQPGTWPWFCRA